MRPVRLSEDVVPVAEFKVHASRWLRHASETGAPVVITQNGRAAGVLLSPLQYDRLVDQARFLESVQAGLQDADAGRTMDTPALRERLREARRKREAP